MWLPDGYEAVPFHSDISEAASTAAGSFTLYACAHQLLCIEHVRISTDTAQRIVVCTADKDGQRILAGWFPADGSGAYVDGRLYTIDTAMEYKDVVVITTTASALDASIDGYVLYRINGLQA